MATVALFGPIDTVVGPVIEYVVLVLAIVNLGTRAVAHRQHVRQSRQGADAITRSRLHTVSNVVLVIGSMYYMSIHPHGGMVMTVLVVTAVISDLFEFESRKVEARRGIELERPRAAIAASILVVSYAGYVSLFFVVKPFWQAIV